MPTKISAKVGIIGGHQADITEYPFLVSVQNSRNEHLCGGALISDRWVLTSAHCAFFPEDATYIRSGSSFCGSGGEVTGVIKKIINAGFGNTTRMHKDDIALLKLRYALRHDRYSFVKLSSKLVVLPRSTIVVLGWGSLREDSFMPSQSLYEVKVKVHSNAICELRYEEEFNNDMFCAGEFGKDACNADSGGPALIGQYLVGVIAYGEGCGRRDYPGVYVKVQKYISWIKTHTGISES